MNIIKTEIPDLFILNPQIFRDDRGFFFESFSQRDLASNNLHYNFVQDNQSKSQFGVIRGLHFQLNPHAQSKLIRVLVGKILDVVVDIRKGSPTFGKHIAVELSAENKLQLLIPQGFAHGFSVLEDNTEIAYKCDNYYNQQSEGGILFNDPALNIDWKIDISKAIVSEKDQNLPTFMNANSNFNY